jgi:hypothetical protein
MTLTIDLNDMLRTTLSAISEIYENDEQHVELKEDFSVNSNLQRPPFLTPMAKIIGLDKLKSLIVHYCPSRETLRWASFI